MDKLVIRGLRQVTLNCFNYQSDFMSELMYRGSMSFYYSYNSGYLRCLDKIHMLITPPNDDWFSRLNNLEVKIDGNEKIIRELVRRKRTIVCSEVVGEQLPNYMFRVRSVEGGVVVDNIRIIGDRRPADF